MKKYYLGKKGVVFSLFVSILLGASSIPTVGAVPDTHQVNPGGSIQAAINAASDGDTILVHSGTYTENNIVINKNNIHLVGENNENTIICGNGEGILRNDYLTSDVVYVSGFTFRDFGNNFAMIISASGGTITDNIIVGEDQQGVGISVADTVYCYFSNNVIMDTECAMYFFFARLNQFECNIFMNNYYAIYMVTPEDGDDIPYPPSHDNLIYHNDFIDNTHIARIDSTQNINQWDNGYPSGGNYWKGHYCVGNPSNGAYPLNLGFGNVDHYPFEDPCCDHYLSLISFPFYTATVPTGHWYDQMCGAACAQMTLNYLFWDSYDYPQGPEMLYNDQHALFHQFHTGGGDYITADEMAAGLNSEIHPEGDFTHGYFFSTYANTNVNEVLKQIGIWMDYYQGAVPPAPPLYWPQPGHPYHSPAMVPIWSDYPQYLGYGGWVVIRGIHANQNAWPPSGIIGTYNLYGLWINDPYPGEMDENTYKTTTTFIEEYYTPLYAAGDPYDGKYVTVIDPAPGVDQSSLSDFNDFSLQVARAENGFTQKEVQLVRQGTQQNAKLTNQQKIKINEALVKAASIGVKDVLIHDAGLFTAFEKCSFIKSLYVRNTNSLENYHLVVFTSAEKTFIVRIGEQGQLKEFSYSNGPADKYLAKYSGVGTLEHITGQSFFEPAIVK